MNRTRLRRLISLRREVNNLNKKIELLEKKNDVLVKLSLQKEEIINILKEKIIKGGHIISYVVPKLRYPDGTTLYDMSSFAAHKTQELFDSQKIQFVNELMNRKLIKRYDTDDVIRFEIHLAAEI